MIKELLQEVNIITVKGKTNPKFQNILDMKPSIKQLLLSQAVKFGIDDLKLTIRLIIQGYEELPTCKMCSNLPKYHYVKNKFNEYCSHECAWKDPDNVKKSKRTKLLRHGSETYNNRLQSSETCLKRYGVTTPAKNKDVQEKAKKTTLERYGVENVAQSSELQQKRQQTNIEKYGVAHPVQNPSIKQKIHQTMLDKHGVLFPAQNPISQQKRQQTNIEKYGVAHPAQNLLVQQKIELTNIERYGSKSSASNTNVQKKKKKTLRDRYGTDILSQRFMNPESIEKLDDKEWLIKQHEDQQKTLIEIASDLDVSLTTVSNRYQKHSIPITRWSTSLPQKQLQEFIESLVQTNVITNDRSLISPQELDIYIPDRQIAIELNGIYWHSEISGKKDNNYHLSKLEKLNEKNIRLIQITDEEWINKNSIVKGKIKSLLMQNERIYARKCEIRQISNADYKQFIESNHIQGYATSRLIYGLFCNSVLVAVMSFNKPRFSKKHDFELIRYCTLSDYTVVGGASKLFCYFIRNNYVTSVISYCDLRYGTGNMYKKLNFTKTHRSKPNYKYFNKLDPYKLLSRQYFQKHKLKNKLNVFDPKLTEWENMKVNGYDRIWDCGNDVYVWNNT